MGSLNSRKVIIPAVYAVIIAGAYLLMPSSPDSINAPMDLVISFRIASAITLSIFWGLLGVIFGAFWDKLDPDKTTRISIRQE
jgi:predicted cobalt transporter CbtA